MMQKLPIKYIETDIVNRCNLNCRGCGHFSPLYKNDTWEKDLADFEKELTRLSEIFFVETLRIMGGEPLLHSSWLDCLRIARKCMPDTVIFLVTNGLLLERLIENSEELNKLGIIVCVSNYNIRTIPQEFFEKFAMYRFVSKGSFYNVSMDLSGSQDYEASFNECSSTSCHQLRNGRLYLCPEILHFNQFNKVFDTGIEVSEEETSIDIYNNDAVTILEFLNTPKKCCAYCNIEQKNSCEHSWSKSKFLKEEWLQETTEE